MAPVFTKDANIVKARAMTMAHLIIAQLRVLHEAFVFAHWHLWTHDHNQQLVKQFERLPKCLLGGSLTSLYLKQQNLNCYTR